MKLPFSLRIPPDLRAWLQVNAEEEGRSLNGQIVHTLRVVMAAELDKERKK